MVLTLACVTLCGPAVAAPRGGKGRTPQPAPRHQTAKRPPAARHHTPRQQAKHRRPAPAPKRHHAPRHHVRHGGHHRGECDNGWVTLGAAVVGGLVGGILGAFQ